MKVPLEAEPHEAGNVVANQSIQAALKAKNRKHESVVDLALQRQSEHGETGMLSFLLGQHVPLAVNHRHARPDQVSP